LISNSALLTITSLKVRIRPKKFYRESRKLTQARFKKLRIRQNSRLASRSKNCKPWIIK
jgi:hypothetical protein